MRLLRTLLIIYFSLSLSGLALNAFAADGDFEAGMKNYMGMAEGERYKDKMKEFINFAVTGNTDAMVNLVTPEATRQHGDKIRDDIKENIIPFFADYAKQHNVTQINLAHDEDRTVWMFYSYVVTKSGDVKPFWIAISENNGQLYIYNIAVGRCIKNRHPFCP